jgi:hypothetical protein
MRAPGPQACHWQAQSGTAALGWLGSGRSLAGRATVRRARGLGDSGRLQVDSDSQGFTTESTDGLNPPGRGQGHGVQPWPLRSGWPAAPGPGSCGVHVESLTGTMTAIRYVLSTISTALKSLNRNRFLVFKYESSFSYCTPNLRCSSRTGQGTACLLCSRPPSPSLAWSFSWFPVRR